MWWQISKRHLQFQQRVVSLLLWYLLIQRALKQGKYSNNSIKKGGAIEKVVVVVVEEGTALEVVVRRGIIHMVVVDVLREKEVAMGEAVVEAGEAMEVVVVDMVEAAVAMVVVVVDMVEAVVDMAGDINNLRLQQITTYLN